jgi:hypothetical protein
MTTLTLTAYFNYHRPELLQGAKFQARFATLAEAEAVVALFPKSSRLRAVTLRGDKNGATALVDGVINLAPNGTNGERNETGEKRYHTIMARAAKVGVTVEYVVSCGNAYPSREAFEAELA